MKALFRLSVLVATLFFLGACGEDDHSYPEVYPTKIVHSQISGTWQLTQWNGAGIADGLYFYITLESRDQKFTIYQNFDSAKARHQTGTYLLNYEESEGNTITGVYDHASGFWNYTYLIDNLTKENMTWTATDDTTDISIYTRCDAVPEDILNGTRAEF